jgi:hypothetical protein
MLSAANNVDSASLESCSSTPSLGISPGAVKLVGAPLFGDGAGEPLIGMSPAEAFIESVQARATTVRNRFTGYLLQKLTMQDFLHRKE